MVGLPVEQCNRRYNIFVQTEDTFCLLQSHLPSPLFYLNHYIDHSPPNPYQQNNHYNGGHTMDQEDLHPEHGSYKSVCHFASSVLTFDKGREDASCRSRDLAVGA